MDGLHQEADRRVGGDDRLEHGGRELSERPPQFPEVHAQDAEQGPEPVHHDAAERRGAARIVHLRRSRHAVGRRSAEPEPPDLPPADRYQLPRPRRRSPTARSRSSRTSRSASTCSRGSRSTTASCTSATWTSPARAPGRRSPATSTSGIGRSRPTRSRSKIDFAPQKNIFFHGQSFTASGMGDFTGTFHLFKGGRELKGTFTSPVAGRERVAVPEPARLRALGARSAGDHEHDRAGLRRDRPVRLPDGAVRPPRRADPRDVGRRLPRRRPVPAHRFPGDQGAAAGRQRDREEPARMAAREVGAEDRRRRSDRAAAGRRQADDPRAPAGRHRAGGRPAGGRRPVQLAPVARLPPDRRPHRLRARSAVDRPRRQLDGDREHLRAVPGTHRLRRAVAHAVPRHQPGLAGERPRAGRHHDDFRRADRRGADRRQRRVRRADARVVLEAAHRRDVQGRPGARVGRRLGPCRRRRRDREQLRHRVECHHDVGRIRDPRRRTVLARLPAQGSGGRDRRARPAQPPPAEGSAARLSAGRLSDGGPGLRRLPSLRAVRASVRLRQDVD